MNYKRGGVSGQTRRRIKKTPRRFIVFAAAFFLFAAGLLFGYFRIFFTWPSRTLM